MSKITRGTTPYHRFVLPINPQLIDKIYITYKQKGVTVEKAKSDMEFTTSEDTPPIYRATVHLTQADTLKFKTNIPNPEPIEIQMDIKTTTGERLINDPPLRLSVGRVLKDEVI